MKAGRLQLVTCHRLPERSFFFKGKQFPVCARCTGMYIGYLSFPFFTFDVFQIALLPSLILTIPTFLDGLTQAYSNRESNNFIRVTTGFISGIGQMSLVSIIGKSIGNYIINHFL